MTEQAFHRCTCSLRQVFTHLSSRCMASAESCHKRGSLCVETKGKDKHTSVTFWWIPVQAGTPAVQGLSQSSAFRCPQVNMLHLHKHSIKCQIGRLVMEMRHIRLQKAWHWLPGARNVLVASNRALVLLIRRPNNASRQNATRGLKDSYPGFEKLRGKSFKNVLKSR